MTEIQEHINRIRSKATEAQHRAADPATSVWVSANAGTGKTRVLTNRILRLLVDGAEITDILAVTYTRAAAQEMRNRVFETLATWATTSVLTDAMRRIGIDAPTQEQIGRARQLFALLLDQPVGLRIETVHAFAQSVLRRFPVEAGVQPYFELASDAEALQIEQEVATRLLTSGDALIDAAIKEIASTFGKDRVFELIKDFSSYSVVLEGHNPTEIKRQIFAMLDSDSRAADNPAAARQVCFLSAAPDAARRDNLQQIIKAIHEYGTEREQIKAAELKAWIDHPDHAEEAAFNAYADQFLTREGTIRARLLTKGVMNALTDGDDFMVREAEFLMHIYHRLHGIDVAVISFHVLVLATAMAGGYRQAKEQAGLMDYDDLIRKTQGLLTAEGGAAWVRYKLDRGINHLLVDEAQDTSEEQWGILKTLADEFFTGQEDEDPGKPPRSLFSVGDYKQSIYSFQGADPDIFNDQERAFKADAERARKPFSRVDLDTSFRSVTPILRVVDTITQTRLADGGGLLPGLGEDPPLHVAEREGQGGFIEVLELVSIDDHEQDAKIILARRIVGVIKSWLGVRVLPSRGRAMTAGDIMILLRDRQKGGLYHVLDRELRLAGLPVAGADRIRLSEDIAVRDLLALGRAVLLPEDDLSLAAVLKSPLFGLSEEDLFHLAAERGRARLHIRLATLAADDARIAKAHERFTAWLDLAERRTPHDFYSSVLSSAIRQDFARRLGNHTGDVLAEFLEAARQYEMQNPPSLLGFIEDVEVAGTEIKRESEARPHDEIRIMTMHGAKGLESPVVILPDTLYREPKAPSVIPMKAPSAIPILGVDEVEIPVVQLAGRCPHPGVADAAAQARQRSLDENDRLFYVAMTRAEDGLLVAGFDGGRRKLEGSWYDAISTALMKIDTDIKNGDAADAAGLKSVQKIADSDAGALELKTAHKGTDTDGTSDLQPVQKIADADGTSILRLESVQSLPPEPEPLPEEAPPDIAAPPWLVRPAPVEATPPRPLSPSRFAGADAPRSPVGIDRKKAMEKGVLVHRMLELLPRLEGSVRLKAAARIIEVEANHLSGAERVLIRDQVLGLMSTPSLAALFGSHGRAEVPISGLVGAHVVSGVIDRLVVGADQITLIDFKTGTPPRVESRAAAGAESGAAAGAESGAAAGVSLPHDGVSLPQDYVSQMALYRHLVEKIWPGREVAAGLLYTENAHLYWVDAAEMDAAVTRLMGGG